MSKTKEDKPGYRQRIKEVWSGKELRDSALIEKITSWKEFTPVDMKKELMGILFIMPFFIAFAVVNQDIVWLKNNGVFDPNGPLGLRSQTWYVLTFMSAGIAGTGCGYWVFDIHNKNYVTRAKGILFPLVIIRRDGSRVITSMRIGIQRLIYPFTEDSDKGSEK